MTPEELYRLWAPPHDPWSRWAAPALFGQIPMEDVPPAHLDESLNENLKSLGAVNRIAVIIDLPAERAFQAAFALAAKGYRPVPIFNAAHAEPSVIDMRKIFRLLCAWTPVLQRMPFAVNADPAFFLDSQRDQGESSSNAHDNRWLIFSEDLPSADYLKAQGINDVIVVQENVKQPKRDLRRILLEYQTKSIAIHLKAIATSALPQDFIVLPITFAERLAFRIRRLLNVGENAITTFGNYLDSIERSGSGG